MDLEEAEINEGAAGAAGSETRKRILIAIAIVSGLIIAILAFMLFGDQTGRSLRPFRSEPTGVDFIVDGQPLLVTFPELSDNAANFHNQRIRVTGRYLPLEVPTCILYNGPLIQWSLVSEGLQLNARGFESALSLVTPGTALTVEGMWRLYAGPAGCGKEPETANVWYLQVERIIQPNPLVSSTIDPSLFLLEGISTPIFPTVAPTTITQVTRATETPAGPGTATATPTATATGTVVLPTPSLPPGTVPPTPTNTPTPFVAGTATPTLAPGTGTATPTPTVAGTVGPTDTPNPVPTSPPINPYPGEGTPTISPPLATATQPSY